MTEICALDIDSVLADFMVKMADVVQKKYGVDLNIDVQTQVDFRHAYCFNHEEEREMMKAIFTDNNNFPPVHGALEGYKELEEMGFEVISITARKEREITYDWLKKNNFSSIVPFFLDLGDEIPMFDYLLDDSPKKIARLEPYIRKQAFLMDTPQNENCVDLKNRFIRVRNWDDFVRKIKEMHA